MFGRGDRGQISVSPASFMKGKTMILNDWHLHTRFSSDSDERMENLAEAAVRLGMTNICVTDHYDMDYPTGEFVLDTEAYLKKLREVGEMYRGRCGIFCGVEMGLLPGREAAERVSGYMESQPYDFIIGSVHCINGVDPYYRDRIEADDPEMYRMYFACVLECLRACRGFQTLGHLDYVVRYGYSRGGDYHWEDYRDLIDLILEELVSRGIALELNTAGLRQGLGFPNPQPGILARYRELGGEMVTVGSDAHRAQDLAYGFYAAWEILRQAGFRYVTEFREKTPYFLPIYT